MATENDKGKGKEAGIENKPAQQLFGWFGRFQDGKWFCDCNIRARCKRVTKPNSPNLGKLCKLLLKLLYRLQSNPTIKSGRVPKTKMTLTNARSLFLSTKRKRPRSGCRSMGHHHLNLRPRGQMRKGPKILPNR
jgi:hypothetical protein